MSRRLNLASQPLRNETLPGLLVGAACVLVLAGTARHAWVVRALLPAQTSARDKEVAALEAEVDQLRAEGPALLAQRTEPAALKEWSQLKEMVDRRALGWTELFAQLEEVLPRNVRLVSIAPHVEKGEVKLELSAVARSPEDGFEFLRRLEARGGFADAVPTGVSEAPNGAGSEFRYTMRYLPEHVIAASPSPPPVEKDQGTGEAGGEEEENEPPRIPKGTP